MTAPHVVSTRKLGAPARGRFARLGWRLTQHNFIQKRMALPPVTREAIAADVVLTSSTAVRAFALLAAKILLPVANCRVHCLAHATRNAAERAGFCIASTAPDARTLAMEILKTPGIRSVTHVCGSRRLTDLSDTLQGAGVAVTDVVAYQTELTPLKLTAPFDGILFFSPSAIDSFCMANETNPAPCFCIGQTTAQHARQRGFPNIYAAAGATEAALTDLAIAHLLNTYGHVKK
jgi:uroporphyrinogen-III synthase